MAAKSLVKPLAISLGDSAGIGPEILRETIDHLGSVLIFGSSYLKPKKLPVSCGWQEISGDPVEPGKPSKESGRQAYEAFFQAAQSVKDERCRALVTLPLAKKYVSLSYPDFRGHTEELGRWWSADPLMLLMGGSLKVALITRHLPLKNVSQELTFEKVVRSGEILRRSLKQQSSSSKEPRLSLLALNPHAGEGGLLGDEEEKILLPALRELQKRGGNWSGLHAADSFFARGQWGDAVLAPYHDQGLIPVKMLAQGYGVNLTLGLPFIRVSPDHGTAFDIAGQNRADPRAFLEAIKIARQLSQSNENVPDVFQLK